MSYITVDWTELFTLHYNALFIYLSDQKKAIELAFRYWKSFGERCSEGFLSNVKRIDLAEPCILAGLKNSHNWEFQLKCFKLLEQLHARLCEEFDKVSQAKDLINHNVNFYLFVIEGLSEQSSWQAVVETADVALSLIPLIEYDPVNWMKSHNQNEIRAAVYTMMVDAYEKIKNFTKAFVTAKNLFLEMPSFSIYTRARNLAEKGSDTSEFSMLVEKSLRQSEPDYSYQKSSLLLNIYSYEGEIDKMLRMTLSEKIGRSYYKWKYAALSLIYRALSDEADIENALSDYLKSAFNEDGIAGMIKKEGDTDLLRQTELLLNGGDLLKEVVSFHIAAAKRERYAKAAYYMCVLRDIYIYLKQEDDFRSYFGDIILQNNRRPALKDEMSLVYGKAAVKTK
jgi:hypothetical protein